MTSSIVSGSMKLALLAALAGVASSGCRTVSGSAPPPPMAAPLHHAGPAGAWHVVAAGETWAELAAGRGVPLEDLLEINGVGSAGPLKRGDVVFLLDPQRPNGVGSGGVRTESNGWLWPLRVPAVSSRFGTRDGRVHEGIDLAAPIGTPVQAVRDGFVLYAGDGVSGYGNMIVLQHPGDLLTVYAHGSLLLVKTGDRVRQGQEIARVGQSGRATAPHLHFEVRQGEVPLDPLSYLPSLR